MNPCVAPSSPAPSSATSPASCSASCASGSSSLCSSRCFSRSVCFSPPAAMSCDVHSFSRVRPGCLSTLLLAASRVRNETAAYSCSSSRRRRVSRRSKRLCAPSALLLFFFLSLSCLGGQGTSAREKDERYSNAKSSRERHAESRKHTTNGVCLPSMGFLPDVPRDRRDEVFLACHEHEGNTCCQRRDTESILRRLAFYFTPEAVKSDVSFPPKNCASFTSAALCSKCDARVGVGKMTRKNAPLLCRSFCERWYHACENDYFAPAPSGSPQALTFCYPDSVICSPLRDVARDGATFCSKLGFEVAGLDREESAEQEEEEDAAACYDGVPAAALFGPAPKPPRTDGSGAYGSYGRQTWRHYLLWLQYRLSRCIEALVPRPEFWLFAFLCLYFVGKVFGALRSIVDRAAFQGAGHQLGSAPGYAWASEGATSAEASEQHGGLGGKLRMRGVSSAEETVSSPCSPLHDERQNEASKRAAAAAEARWAQRGGQPSACRVRNVFPPSSRMGGSDDEEEVLSTEAVREILAGR
uniref:Folate receptor family protein n=1 Tax=Toxoplasma gondii COUG TaxID=1074873 RepID=A0A2G8Y953_TOXGO|nr:folate receptor family protein [Toxoplasma gondii COUG]